MARALGRRGALATLLTGLVGGLVGCVSAPSFPGADVVAGPDGRLVFDPESISVAVGDRVTWGFASSGHNVSCRPQHSDEVELPDAADPFASYGSGGTVGGSNVPQGETYARTFDVPGRYVYVCLPHVTQGMVGTVHVDAQ